MKGPGLVLWIGVLLVGLGMALLFAGIVVPATFLVGVYLVGTGMVVLAVAGVWAVSVGNGGAGAGAGS